MIDSVSAFHGRERLYHHLLAPPLEKRIQTFAIKLLFGEVSIAEAQRLLGGEPARVGAIQEAALLKSTKCDTMGREGVDTDDVRFPQDFLRAMQRLEALVIHIFVGALGAKAESRVVHLPGAAASTRTVERSHFNLAPDAWSAGGEDTVVDQSLRLRPSERLAAAQACFDHLRMLCAEQRRQSARVTIDLKECQRQSLLMIDGDAHMAGLVARRLAEQVVREQDGGHEG